MKILKKLLFVFLAVTLTLVFSDPLLAAFGSQGGAGGEGGVVPDENCVGTATYRGPLTIYFSNFDIFNGTVDMYFFLRLKVDDDGIDDFMGFSGKAPSIFADVEDMTEAVREFIADTVTPILYPDATYTPFCLKKVKKIVEDQDGGCCDDELPFAIMNVVLKFAPAQ